MGFVRNLSSSEIVDQVAWSKRIWEAHTDSRLTNIVFMGMGEPLRNYDNVVEALRVLLDPIGLNFSKRKITVSTSGVVPILERFGQEDLDVNVAISLNATTDAVRDKIMPVNQKWNLAELLGVLRRYPLNPNRRITFEYVMLSKVNDTDGDAKRLIKMLHGLPSKVNLIPWNPFAGAQFERPERGRIQSFKELLLAAGVNATIRESRGSEELAACGQLGQPAKAAEWRDQHRESRRRGLERG
jgi:23S rRNA (adenine2503-C2)-methyltransferase